MVLPDGNCRSKPLKGCVGAEAEVLSKISKIYQASAIPTNHDGGDDDILAASVRISRQCIWQRK